MKIRKYTDSDKIQVVELLRLNTPQYFSPSEERDFIYYLQHYADNYYVVDIQGSVVGCGGFNLSDDGKTGKISWDIIHPDNQGQGVGSQLTRLRIQRMKEIEGVKTISVRTSQLAYRFYAKFGLELREVVKDYWDKGFDLYRLDSAINLIN